MQKNRRGIGPERKACQIDSLRETWMVRIALFLQYSFHYEVYMI